MSDSQRKRGKKLCQDCGAEHGVRTYECECGYEFPMKKKRKGRRKVLVEDFKTLKEGDEVKLVGGSGPYYVDDAGDRHYLIDRGRYKVVSRDANGLIVVGKHGYGHLYMGKTCEGLVPSITKQACKLLLLK